MNCSEDPSRLAEEYYRVPFAFWTLGVISIILSVLANAGNLVNLFVLTRRHMRSTMTTLLVTLAWADLVPPTVVSLNSILFYYFLPHMNNSSTFLTIFVIFRSLFTVLANIFTTFSNWLIVLITTFRLIVVKKPLLAKNYCNRSTARYTILIIFILSVCVNIPFFLYTSIKMYCTNDEQIIYYGFETSLILDTRFFQVFFYPTIVVTSLLIPWLICFLIWLFLIRALRTAQTQLTTKTNNATFTNDRKQDTYFRITLMIVCVLTVYMICRSLHLAEALIHILIAPLIDISNQEVFYQMRIKFICISNIMLTVNHGANFYIYSINPKFRLTIKLYVSYYFRRCRIKRRRAFTIFHLRRKRTNDSLDILSVPNDFNRSLMLTSLNGVGSSTKLPNHPNRFHHSRHHLEKPQKYIQKFVDQNSNNENSEKSYVWKAIEHRLKHSPCYQ